MNIIVCVKQVPEIQLVKATDNGLELPAGPGQINPFDAYALEEALKLKEGQGASVSAVTVGPDSATAVLREAASLGVETLYHCNDAAFEGSDPIATARILAAAVGKIGSADLIITGKQAVDEDASAVGPALAGFLNIPQVMFVKKVESIGDGQATVHRQTEDGYDVVEVKLPAVISVVKEINEPRLPSLKGKMQAKKAQITTWNAGDLGVDANLVGPHSPSQVLRNAPPAPRPPAEMLEGEPAKVAEELFQKLRDAQVI
jgi:electron transfer flavoprotein beta subunit